MVEAISLYESILDVFMDCQHGSRYADITNSCCIFSRRLLQVCILRTAVVITCAI